MPNDIIITVFQRDLFQRFYVWYMVSHYEETYAIKLVILQLLY